MRPISFSKALLKVPRLFVVLLVVLVFRAHFAVAQQAPQAVALASETALLAPPQFGGPLVVGTSFQLLAINDIDDKDETFEFVGVLTLKWRDQRLAFDPAQERVSEKIYQGDYQINQVFTGWSPQVVLLNQSGLFETSASFLRIQPDGAATLTQMINAVAEVKLSMRRLPFDRQRLEAIFGVFGFDKTRVLLRAEPEQANEPKAEISIDQWTVTDKQFLTRELMTPEIGSGSTSSLFVLSLDVRRDSFFLIRLVILPLAFIVMLSWSVFWMDRASLGDRLSICFVGILTAVAYQIVVGDLLPHIAYVTFMNAFLNISFFMMSAAVVVNLVIGSYERRGRTDVGDMIEYRCRWIFPATYIGLSSLALAASFIFY